MIIFTVITNYTGVYILKNHFFVKAAEINYLKSPKLVTFHQVKPYGYTNLKKIKNTYIYIYISKSLLKKCPLGWKHHLDHLKLTSLQTQH